MSITNKPSSFSNIKAALSLTVGMSALIASGGFQAVAQSDTDEEARLGTIVVSATKRDSTLQDVPVAVSVVDDVSIERAEIQDLSDLQSIVPSLQINQLQSSTNTNFIIRGFGNGANNAGIEPSVGVFIDGVYRSRSASAIADLPNLERVEVLRGPQSTLFGKNASAGVISVVTREPQFEFQGNAEIGVSNFNGLRLKGDVTGPITDTLAYSVSGNINKRDGYATDLALQEESNERNRAGLRGELLFKPSDSLKFRLIGDIDLIDEICCVAGNLINGPTGQLIALSGGQINGEDPFSYEVFGNVPSTNVVNNNGVSLQADYDMGFATLTSITAQRQANYKSNQDSDFTSADLISQNFNDTNIDTFTQEVRLTSNTDGKFDWMVGGYYFDETVEINNVFLFGENFRTYADLLGFAATGDATILATAVAPLAGIDQALLGADNTGSVEAFGQDDNAVSIFGTIDYHVSDKLTATIGLNYTKADKDAFGRIENTDVLSGLDLVQLGYVALLDGILQANGAPSLFADPVGAATFAATNPAAYASIQQTAVIAARDVANVTSDPTTLAVRAALGGDGTTAANPLAGVTAFQFLPPFVNFPNAVEDGSTSDTNTSYSLRLAYDVNDNVNFYGSYATGFKASSWNLSRDSRPFPTDYIPSSNIVDPLTMQVVSAATSSPITDAGLAVNNLTSGTRFAEPEEAKVIEIGMKSSFENFSLNVALFEQTIEGFQSNVFTGTGFALANAGEQSTIGLEFDGLWAPTDNLTISFAGTLLDPKYDSFPSSAAGDISGTTPSGIPEVSTSLGVNYDMEFEHGTGYIRADWQYTSDTDFFDAIDPNFRDPNGNPATDNNLIIAPGDYTRAVDVINVAAGVTTENNITFSAWARNLFNDQRITTAFPSVAQAGSISGYPSQPRTYGITVKKSF